MARSCHRLSVVSLLLELRFIGVLKYNQITESIPEIPQPIILDTLIISHGSSETQGC
jgi:hypothetical protein